MNPCIATYVDSYRYSDFAKAMPPMPCTKTVDEQGRHIGQHQTFLPNAPLPAGNDIFGAGDAKPASVRLVHWSSTGASLQTYDPNVPNTNCMCQTNDRMGHQPEDHRWTTCSTCGNITDTTKTGEVSCSSCGIWLRRVADVKGGAWRYLRTAGDDYLYSFSASNPGGFGGRRYTITMLDGTVVCRDKAGLWSAGRMPWWLEDEFPPNCTIESGSGTDKVPGYTDRSGNPLAYTGGPEPLR